MHVSEESKSHTMCRIRKNDIVGPDICLVVGAISEIVSSNIEIAGSGLDWRWRKLAPVNSRFRIPRDVDADSLATLHGGAFAATTVHVARNSVTTVHGGKFSPAPVQPGASEIVLKTASDFTKNSTHADSCGSAISFFCVFRKMPRRNKIILNKYFA